MTTSSRNIAKSLLLAGFVSLSCTINAAVLGIYEFTGTSSGDNQLNSVTAQPTGALFSTVTRTGVTWNSGANYFNSAGWNVTATVDTAEYVQFTFTVASGYTATLDSLGFFQQGSNTVADEFRVAYSFDNFATTAGFVNDTVSISPGSTESVLLNATVLGGQSIGFRFYVFGDVQADGSGVPSATGTFRLDNITLNGSLSAVPEPSSFAALAGVGALGFCALRRRRSV